MKLYVSSYNGVLDEYKRQIDYTIPRDADKLILWQDCAGSNLDLVKACKTFFPKPIYTIQHGRRASRDYDAPMNRPYNSDLFLAWGKWDYDNMTRLGHKAEIVGCPLNTWIKPRVPHKEPVVLFVPVNTGKEEPNNIMVYTELQKMKLNKVQSGLTRNYDALRKTWGFNGKKTVTRNELSDNFTIVTKCLPWHDQALYSEGFLKGYQDSEKNNRRLFDLLRNVDVVVGLDEGTTELFATAFDVPVIVVDGFEYRWVECTTQVPKTPGITHCKIEELQDQVELALAHPEYLREERRAIAENEMSVDSIKDPVSRLHEIIGSNKI